MTRRPTFDPSRIVVPESERSSQTDPSLITVSALTQAVKAAITRSLPSTLHVLGEISNYKRHGSGHVYFTLKDRGAEVSCVMWRSAAKRMRFQPADGTEVIATGTVDVYPKSGRYQLYVRKLEPRGVGALELAFRQLREKLEKEGLFEARHKKRLPAYPQRIALVTSPTGAAIRDILQTARRRHGGVSLLLYPVRVQGESAGREIADAIETINRHRDKLGGIDLLIVARGGGSLEDLWAFNEEVVARAIFASEIPIVSGVGHEVDVTIADLVADVRAATPTAAAELAVPVKAQLLDRVADLARKLDRSMRFRLTLADERVRRTAGHPSLSRPMQTVRHRAQQLDELAVRLDSEWRGLRDSIQDRLGRCELRLIRRRPAELLAKRTGRLQSVQHRMRWVLSRVGIVRERTVEQLDRRLFASSPAHQMRHLSERVNQFVNRLEAGSHTKVLQRGFSITRHRRSGALVTSPSDVRDGDRVVTETRDGSFESEVLRQRQLALFSDPEGGSASEPRRLESEERR